ncbi:hypothetical protein [Nakamurella sp.]|uniref:hypothetical protein n=1 Tax=Nakamurella sp. TaxID=1869182 RepID=UPI0037836C2D
MTIRRGWAVGAVLASMVVLAGCSSGSSSSGTTSTASSSTASSSTASSTTSSATAESSFEASRPVATTTVGGDATSLDEQSTAWFSALCTGMAPLGDLTNASTQQEVSDAMIAAGEAFRSTGETLGTLPPPTFDGGDVLAENTQSGFQVAATAFTDLGNKVLEIKDGDTAGQQQIAKDLQAAAQDTPIAQMQLTPALTAAVQQIPACQKVFGGS